MKELVIISGKGGSGKTTVSASFASLAKNSVISDCDVDAPNMHILMKPEKTRTHDFHSGLLAEIDQNKCTFCGLCYEHCRFDAIDKSTDKSGKTIYRIDELKCEGCSLCDYVCKANAIKLSTPKRGVWMESDTKYCPMIHALLDAGGENSGKLVSLVKSKARVKARDDNADVLIVDGPPGVGCPVIASISGADLLLLVTEPTQSGKHDMERVIQLADSFKMKVAMCINKWDINPEVSAEIDRVAKENGVMSVGRIRYDESVPRILSEGKIIVEQDGEVSADIKSVWSRVQLFLH